MPIYEYKCISCRKTYEIFHKGHEVQEDVVCPSCNSSDYKRLISASSVISTDGSTTVSSTPSCEYGESGCCSGDCKLY